jgi:hypothetical protein
MNINLRGHDEMEAWLRAESERTGKPVTAILREAISEYAAGRGAIIPAEIPYLNRKHVNRSPYRRRRGRKTVQ